MIRIRWTLVAWIGVWLVSPMILKAAQDSSPTSESTPQDSNPLILREGFVLSPGRGFGGRGRNSLPKDPIEAAWISGALQLPDPSQEESPSAEGLSNWRRIKADENGSFADRELSSGWLIAYVETEKPGVWLLRAQGHASVRVNGEPRVGDIYSHGIVEIPVPLQAGRNTLIFTGARGRVQAQLTPASKPIYLHPLDPTFPQIVRGETEELWGALVVANATGEWKDDLSIRTSGTGIIEIETAVPAMLPFSIRKVPFRVQPQTAENVAAQPQADLVDIKIELVGNEGKVVDNSTVNWEIRNSDQIHRRTFRSDIDGSVQFYGVVPPQPNSLDDQQKPSLILTLHGAGVDGFGQANVYAQKPNAYVVAATNRRPFGFDWEDWGRWDALEVLAQASQRFAIDPRRTCLTGHSMGGHGTWHIGSLFPDRFTAIGPSAGWISFATYAGGNPNQADDPVSQMLRRPLNAGDTLARVNNLATQGIYVLHGDQDDNVPVGQARTMREQLAKFHPDFVYKEQPGAGHWWGNECCDWPPMMAFFAAHELADSSKVNRIEFASPGPNVSPSAHWATIWNQFKQGELSRIVLQLKDSRTVISGVTENVRTLKIDLKKLGVPASSDGQQKLQFSLDGNNLPEMTLTTGQVEIVLQRNDEGWSIVTGLDAGDKTPTRCGTFKEAFRNRFVLVYGTHGSQEENEWMFARARFDAETFWYRGNGSVDVVSDVDWKDVAESDRNLIVYGNATVNAAWASLLENSPVQIKKGSWSVPGENEIAESACSLMTRPRPGSQIASVGAIGGTDLIAMRATNRLPIFSSGTGYPDLLVVGSDFLKEGVDAVRLTGYFGPNWGFESGEWARPSKEQTR